MEIKKLNYGWGVKLAVLLIICVQYTVTITSPILGTIMEAFPEHASMVKLLETIPHLCSRDHLHPAGAADESLL